MIELVDYLKTNGLEALKSQFGINASRHGKYPNLVSLKYNQIESPKDVKIIQQCRGIILDESDNWKIVGRAFDRFFNYGEFHASNIDWNSSKVVSKLDGSLIIAYPYKNEWLIATSGTADANAPLPVLKNVTFNEMFWKVWNELGYKFPERKDCCYAFEFMTPYNRVVVQYKTNDIVLLGARQVENQQELDPVEIAKENGWKYAPYFNLNTIEDILKSCDEINPMENEGYVVYDKDFNRIKIKSPQYVAIHHIRSSMSARRMMEIIATNENEEFLLYFEEYRPLYNEIKQRYDLLISSLQELYDKFKHLEVQKDFALAIKDFPGSSLLFSLRANKIYSIKEGFKNMTTKGAENLLNLRNIDEQIFSII